MRALKPAFAHCESRMRARCRGMGLVEVLVAMLVLAIGLLGLASLFLRSLAGTRSAWLRTQAVSLVSDMTERIRANVGARDAYDLSAYASPADRGCAPTDSTAGVNCGPVALAEDDLARWREAVRQALPPASAGTPSTSVEYLAGAPSRYRVSVAWQEPGEAAPFSFSSELVVQGAP